MKYAVLIPAFSHGVRNVKPGLTYHLAQQAIALHRVAEPRGIRVYVASTPAEDTAGLWDRVEAAFEPSEIIRLADESTSLSGAASEILDRERLLVVHCHGSRQLRAVAGLRRAHPDRVRVVYTVHSFRNATWKRRPYSFVLSKWLSRHADYTIFLSPRAVREFVNNRALFAGGNAGVIPMGVDIWKQSSNPNMRTDEMNPALVTALNASGAFRFVYLAAFKPGKGHEWLVRAAAPVLTRRRHVQILLAGWGDPTIKRRVRALVENLGLSNQVVLPGTIERTRLRWLFAHCHAGVVPSVSETFGQCIIEPMAAGLPVVGTRRGVGQWLIIDYRTGIGVPYGDHAAMSRALAFLADNPHSAAAMGADAEAIVRRIFDWEAVARSHLNVYDSLMSPLADGHGD